VPDARRCWLPRWAVSVIAVVAAMSIQHGYSALHISTVMCGCDGRGCKDTGEHGHGHGHGGCRGADNGHSAYRHERSEIGTHLPSVCLTSAWR
jgi:hypothetical protein